MTRDTQRPGNTTVGAPPRSSSGSPSGHAPPEQAHASEHQGGRTPSQAFPFGLLSTGGCP